jgi:glycine/D-amino acid oxidase-like deaminating enzyme
VRRTAAGPVIPADAAVCCAGRWVPELAALAGAAGPVPADGRSIVGWLPGADGVYVAVTHSGVTLGAHLARLVTAELVTGAVPAALAPYRPGRFTAARYVPETGIALLNHLNMK